MKSVVSAGLVRIALILVLTAGLLAGGCGNNMARMEENQLRLQALVEMNAHQIGKVAQQIEANQENLHEAIESVRSNTENLAGDIASVVSEHVKLQKSIRAGDAQITAKITGIEDKQANLHSLTLASAADIDTLGSRHTQLEERVKSGSETLAMKITAMETDQERLQIEIENAQAGTERVFASLEALADAYTNIEDAAKNDSERTAGRISAINQNQLKQQNEIDSVGSNVRQMAAEMAAIGENLLKLQEVLQNDTRNLADVVEIIGKGQIDFKGKIEKDFLELAGSIGVIEQNQAELAQQAANMQTNTQNMINDLAAALDRLKATTSTAEAAEPPEGEESKNAPPEEAKPQN